MGVWLRKQKKWLVPSLLLTLAGLAYAGIAWLERVNTAVDHTLPETVELLNDHDRAIIRLETENDMLQREHAEFSEDMDDIREILPEIQTDIKWIREALEDD